MKPTKTDLSIIHDIISEYFGIDKDKMFTKDRKMELNEARQWFYYLARILNKPFETPNRLIAEYYSENSGYKRDQAVVIHSTKVIKGLIDVSSKAKQTKINFFELISKKKGCKVIEYKPKRKMRKK